MGSLAGKVWSSSSSSRWSSCAHEEGAEASSFRRGVTATLTTASVSFAVGPLLTGGAVGRASLLRNFTARRDTPGLVRRSRVIVTRAQRLPPCAPHPRWWSLCPFENSSIQRMLRFTEHCDIRPVNCNGDSGSFSIAAAWTDKVRVVRPSREATGAAIYLLARHGGRARG